MDLAADSLFALTTPQAVTTPQTKDAIA